MEITNEMVRDSKIDPAALVLKMLRDRGWRPVVRSSEQHPVTQVPHMANQYECEAVYTGADKARQAPLVIPPGITDVTVMR